MSDLTNMERVKDIFVWTSPVENHNTQGNTNVEDGQSHSAPDIQRENNFQNCESKTDKSVFSFSKMSKRQKQILLISSIACLITRLAYSVLGPFYPREAEKKGMSTTLVGLVFGVFQLIIAVSSPIFGSYLSQLGPRRMYLVGIIVGGLCNIVFGTLDYVPNGAPFIVASMLCRSLEALGFSSFVTASYAIISSEFGSNIGVAFGILVASNGIGFVVGPPLGGGLFEVGGYGLPFYFMGGVTLIYGIFVYKFLPVTDIVDRTRRKRSIFHLLRSPMVVIPMCSLFIGDIGITNIMATFAVHIHEPFGLSAAIVGVVFMIPPFIFAVVSPVWGYLSDKKTLRAQIIISLGHIVFAIGFLLIGPKVLVPFVPFKLWIVCVGLVLIGMSTACFYTPTMKCMVQGALELEFGDDTDMYAMVSGLFNSMDYLGGLVGPVGVGALVDAFGHHMAYTTVGILSLFMAIVCCVFFPIRYVTTGTSRQYSLNHDAIDGNKNRAFVLDPNGDLYWPHGKNGEIG